MIPKIIHQTAPNNIADWHPLWSKCQESWKDKFNSFEYILWNDDDIDSLIEKYYPTYYELYCSFPIHIMKIDFSRFCILDHMGGIYADMDMFCYINFYDELLKNAYVVENLKDKEPIENSLMSGIPNNIFFQRCMKLTKERFNQSIKFKNIFDNIYIIHNNLDEKINAKSFLVFYISGTNLVTTVYKSFDKNYVGRLSGWKFNNIENSYDKEFRTKHMHTVTWGEEDRKKTLYWSKKNNVSYNIQIKNEYQLMREIDIDNFDFYTDYTNGKYPKHDLMNLDYNDYENEIFNFNATYG